jgi:hypothetical protein
VLPRRSTETGDAILGALIDRHADRMVAALSEKLGHFADRPIAEVVREIVQLRLDADAIDVNLHRLFLDRLPDAARVEQRQRAKRARIVAFQDLFERRREDLRVTHFDLAAFLMVNSLDAVVNAVVTDYPERRYDPMLLDEITTLVARYLLP